MLNRAVSMPVKWRTLFSEKLICLKSSVLKLGSLIRAIYLISVFWPYLELPDSAPALELSQPYSCNNSSKKPGSELPGVRSSQIKQLYFRYHNDTQIVKIQLLSESVSPESND